MLEVEYGCCEYAEERFVMEVFIGPGSDRPPLVVVPGLVRYRGGWVLDVKDERDEIMPGLLEVR